MSGENQGPDLFFGGGECLTRHGVWVRRTDMDLEAATREVFTRNGNGKANGRDGIVRNWEFDLARAEWLNEADFLRNDPLRNQISQSEVFANLPWRQLDIRYDLNVLAGRAPDGTQTSNLLRKNDTQEGRLQAAGTLIDFGTAYTFSGFFKRGGQSPSPFGIFTIWDFSANGCRGWFDLENGVVGGTSVFGTGFTPSNLTIEDVGGGWFRCSMQSTAPGTNFVYGGFGNGKADLDNTTAVGDTILAWGGQLEAGSVLTAYQSTPRDTDRKTPSLLLEEAATNQWNSSEEIGDASWQKVSVTVFPNISAITAPDGTTGTADNVTENTAATAEHDVRRDLDAPTPNGPVTVSGYFQFVTRQWLAIRIVDTLADGPRTWFDLVNGVIGEQNTDRATMEALPNGWFRCSVTTDDIGGGGSTPRAFFGLALDDGVAVYTGDGSSTISMWGMQQENRLFASSYIPTVGVAVARASDTFESAFPHPPQAMTVYSRWVNIGRSVARTARIFHIGDSEDNPRFVFRETGGSGWSLQYDDGAGLLVTSSASVQISMFPNDVVEAVCTITADGIIQLADVQFNGIVGSALPGPPAQGGPLPPTWGDSPQFFMGNSGTANRTNARHLVHKVQRGIHDLAFMRAL